VVGEATRGFVNKYLEFIPFKSNSDAFGVALSSQIGARIEDIAKT